MLTECGVRQHGFTIQNSVLTSQELASFGGTLDRVVATAGASPGGLSMRWKVERDPDGAVASLQLNNPEKFFPRLPVEAVSARLLPLAAESLGRDASCADSAEYIYRAPRTGRATEWHQDEAFMSPDVDHRKMTIWIALDDVNDETGCMSYIPGSHLGRILEHTWQPQPMIAEPVDDRHTATIPLLAGDAVAHHCRTIHRVGANRSIRPRRALLIRFHAPGIPRDCPDRRPWLERPPVGPLADPYRLQRSVDVTA